MHHGLQVDTSQERDPVNATGGTEQPPVCKISDRHKPEISISAAVVMCAMRHGLQVAGYQSRTGPR